MAQSDKLVKLYKENIIMLESSMAHEIWAKIKTIINKLVQWRNKLYYLKEHICKKAKEKNAKTECSPSILQDYYGLMKFWISRGS